MKIPATQRIIVEDFPDQKDWIAPLLQVVNKFITDVIATVNGSVEFGSNIPSVDKNFDFTYVSDTVSLPLSFNWTLNRPPKALQVIAATERVNGTFNDVPMMMSAAWQYNSTNEVQITSIVRFTTAPAVALLTASNRYKITVRVTT